MSTTSKQFVWHPGNAEHDHTWDKYFMGIALLSEKRSKDNDRQVGACVVNDEPRVIGIGYNSMPLNCHDSLMPWKGTSEDKKLKHYYVCHAELNAIVNKNPKSVKGCTVYVTLFPCNECAKLIVRSGIKRVVYLSDDKDKPAFQASRVILENSIGKNYLVKFRDLSADFRRESMIETLTFGGGEQTQSGEPGAKCNEGDERTIISWKHYFMALAKLSAQVRSECDQFKGGACVVNEDKRILGLGYAQKVIDPSTENQTEQDDSFYIVSHAAVTAIVNESPTSLRGCTMYVVRYPCNECAKVIVQSGITKIVYLEKDERNSESTKATERMFAIAHIKVDNYTKGEVNPESTEAKKRMIAIAPVKEDNYTKKWRTDQVELDFTPAPKTAKKSS